MIPIPVNGGTPDTPELPIPGNQFFIRADTRHVSTGGCGNFIPQWPNVTTMVVLTWIRGQLHTQFRSVTSLANLTSSGGNCKCR